MKSESRIIPFFNGCRLLIASVLLVALGSTHELQAAEFSSGKQIKAESHGCKCRKKCRGESCCCGPRAEQGLPSASNPNRGVGQVDCSPCFNSTPCGDSGLPTSRSVDPVVKGHMIASFGQIQLEVVGYFLLFATRLDRPTRRFFRLDRPPEHFNFA